MDIVRTITDTIKVLAMLTAIVIVVSIIFARPQHTDPIGDIISQSIITKNQDRHR